MNLSLSVARTPILKKQHEKTLKNVCCRGIFIGLTQWI